jgi:hypothetical protein
VEIGESNLATEGTETGVEVGDSDPSQVRGEPPDQPLRRLAKQLDGPLLRSPGANHLVEEVSLRKL